MVLQGSTRSAATISGRSALAVYRQTLGQCSKCLARKAMMRRDWFIGAPTKYKRYPVPPDPLPASLPYVPAETNPLHKSPPTEVGMDAASSWPCHRGGLGRTGASLAGPKNVNATWSASCGQGAITSGVVVSRDGMLFVASTAGHVCAFWPSGGLRWRYDVPGGAPIYGTPTVGNRLGSDDTVFAADANGGVHAINGLRGEEAFEAKVNIARKEGRRRESILMASPVYSSGLVYMGSSDGYMYVLRSSDGQEAFSFQTNGGVPISSPASLLSFGPNHLETSLAFSDEKGRVYLLLGEKSVEEDDEADGDGDDTLDDTNPLLTETEQAPSFASFKPRPISESAAEAVQRGSRRYDAFGRPVGLGSQAVDLFGRLRGDPTSLTIEQERERYGDWRAMPED
ncbi:hypothetical protein PPROV_000006100 [Pycnococcus provasolii]|uniref:Pyrrolo-quinoline quinone repeat domain-containing protein n=1 Tax=Pycnococcus provasolii TaxID=41880 RepID=A0A830H2F1_9CHLO|nr:hypothetical protein PPROV_000006100 [Pycnococcus provasolii]